MDRKGSPVYVGWSFFFFLIFSDACIHRLINEALFLVKGCYCWFFSQILCIYVSQLRGICSIYYTEAQGGKAHENWHNVYGCLYHGRYTSDNNTPTDASNLLFRCDPFVTTVIWSYVIVQDVLHYRMLWFVCNIKVCDVLSLASWVELRLSQLWSAVYCTGVILVFSYSYTIYVYTNLDKMFIYSNIVIWKYCLLLLHTKNLNYNQTFWTLPDITEGIWGGCSLVCACDKALGPAEVQHNKNLSNQYRRNMADIITFLGRTHGWAPHS